eukprot:2184702-Pyramimonas_sp.AAC.1
MLVNVLWPFGIWPVLQGGTRSSNEPIGDVVEARSTQFPLVLAKCKSIDRPFQPEYVAHELLRVWSGQCRLLHLQDEPPVE